MYTTKSVALRPLKVGFPYQREGIGRVKPLGKNETYLMIGGASSTGAGSGTVAKGVLGSAFDDPLNKEEIPLEKEMKMPCPPIWGPLSVLRNIPKLYV